MMEHGRAPVEARRAVKILKGTALRQDGSDLLTVAEVAAWLRLSPQTIYAWVAAGRVPCVRIGNRIRFLRYDVLRWIEARKEG